MRELPKLHGLPELPKFCALWKLQIQRARDPFAASVPAKTFPAGKEGEKDSGGNLGVHRHLPRYSTRLVSVMYSKERERFQQELFLPGFPTRDNLHSGTEDSYITSHHPAPRPSRRVLITQPEFPLNSSPAPPAPPSPQKPGCTAVFQYSSVKSDQYGGIS